MSNTTASSNRPVSNRHTRPRSPIAQRWDRLPDRKKTWAVAIGFFGLLIVLLLVVYVGAVIGYHPSQSQRAADHAAAVAHPESIEGPDYGQKPNSPGDPGGWEQLALGGLIFAAVGVGAVVLVRASHKNQRERHAPSSPAAPAAPEEAAGGRAS